MGRVKPTNRVRGWSGRIAAIACVVAVPSAACVAQGTQPDETPRDAGATPRADAGETRAPPDASPPIDAAAPLDADPPCLIPLKIELDDDGMGYFDYDHPDCEGGPSFVLDATLIFEDEIDEDDLFTAYPFDDAWTVDDVDYPGLDCAVFTSENRLYCSDADIGELIPIRLVDGARRLDVEFRLEHDAQVVTIESIDYDEG